MKKYYFLVYVLLMFLVTGCQTKVDKKYTSQESMVEKDMKIVIENDGKSIVFELNTSPASQSLYKQLPLELNIEDYGSKEKIFYPPESLNTNGTPMAQGPSGTLAYFSPWGNVAIYYGECGAYNGLYALGQAVEGEELISQLKGHIKISQVKE